MKPEQGIPGYQGIQVLNNDIYGSADSHSSLSYVSSSGIKSVLLNAWNAVKSAVAGMLSSFGTHLCEQLGCDKPGREIWVVRVPCYEAHALSDIAELSNNVTHGGSHNNENAVIISPPEPTPPPVNLSTHPSLSRLPGGKAEAMDFVDNYSLPYDSLKTVNEAQSEAIELIRTSISENYAIPQDVMKAGSTPENDPRGESDYDIPWKSQPDEQLQRRRTLERLNTL